MRAELSPEFLLDTQFLVAFLNFFFNILGFFQSPHMVSNKKNFE